MAIVIILLSLFFFLGLSLGPLLLAAAIAGLSDARSYRLATWSISLGLKSVYRPAITFNTADELLLKRRSYDEKHNSEYVSFGGFFGGVKRYLHDPQDRIHPFYGVPFGFVDELFGLVIDPRDAALGREMHREQSNNQYEHRVEDGQELVESVKAVFELPRGGVGVRLPDVWGLVGGSFDSQVIDYIRDLYEKSQSPKTQTTALRQLLVPIGAFIGVVLLGAFVAGQAGAGAGGGGGSPAPPSGNSSTINVGASLLFLILSQTPWRSRLRNLLFGGIFLAVGLIIAIGLYLAFPVAYPLLGIPLPLGIWAVIFLGVGLLTPPFVAFWFGRSLGPLGVGLGKLYIIIGMLGFDRPVITLDDEEYSVTEYDAGVWAVEPKWYRFAFSRVGVGFRNAPENWPDGTTVRAAGVIAMADGGEPDRAPTGHVATDEIALEDIHGFVPDSDDVSRAAVHVRTDRTTGWMHEAGQARRLMIAALKTAKQDFGGGRKPVGEKWILGSTLVAMGMGAIFDWVVFF